ncbi:MAG: RNB domain-containing ribonuclease [Candidatus Poseidoniaceae archaeon]
MDRRRRGGSAHRQRRPRGPKAPDDDRLWRRLHDALGPNAEEPHTANELWAAVCAREGQALEGPDARRARSTFDAALSDATKRGQRLIRADGAVRLRSRDSVEAAALARQRWQARLDGTEGPDEALVEVLRCWLLETPMEAWPEAWTLLDGERLLTWDTFDLNDALLAWARRVSGLRFREDAPHVAHLLHAAGAMDPLSLIEARLRQRARERDNPFPATWQPHLVEVTNALETVNGEAEVAAGRTDLRHLPFVTIDPHDAKDFDDAVCLSDDKCTLWVAIADVASYVRQDTPLDRAARSRATSVYLPHAVLPMLPPRLADDLCSLRANVDRRAMVLELRLDEQRVVECVPHEAIVRVRANRSYDEVLERGEVDDLLALAAAMREGDLRLELHQAELRPRLREGGHIDVEIKRPNDATAMIETFMVAANAAVGNLLGAAGAPLPWRCHLPPDRVEVEALNARLHALDVNIELPMPSHRTSGQSSTEELSDLLAGWAGGISIDTDAQPTEETHRSEVIDPEARRAMLDALRQAQHAASELTGATRRVVDQSLFQLMQRASYTATNTGHFGLDLDAYAHFTSPIRRYPDLVAHRQLKALMRNEPWPHAAEDMEELAGHCGDRAWAAKRLEWEAVDQAFALHLTTTETATWPARVVSLRTPFVHLDLNDDGALHGRLHLSALSKKSRLHVDDHGLVVESEEHQEPLLRLGERYPCRLRGLDLWTGKLDLAPV